MNFYYDPLIKLRVGEWGAMKYIINSQNRPITAGYHAFYLQNGTLRGKKGSKDEVVFYDPPRYENKRGECE